jgi:type I restriction enzyme S subunit
MGNLRELKVPIPPLNLQNEFSVRLNKLQKIQFINLKSLKKLDNLFASLQHRAFHGEL